MKTMSKLRTALVLCALAGTALTATPARAEVKLAESDGWIVSTDGRVNAFVSHVWGDNRPAGLDSLNWVGFNESTDSAQANADGKLVRTRIRSGYTPSNFALMLNKQVSKDLHLKARIEIGIQITTQEPTSVGDHTWLEPRDAYLNLTGSWGGVLAGRAFALFGRGNLFMNNDLGHNYGVGFPCSYETIFGGACGHIGFGTIYPDHRAQITYSTPKFGDLFQVSAGVFDPRTIPTKSFVQTPLPRVEGEAVFDYHPRKGWGVKAWANAFWQRVGTSANVPDPMTMVETRKDYHLDAAAYGAGLQGDIGPFQLGAAGHMGKGLDGFLVMSFNPIQQGISPTQPYLAEFRPTKAYLVQAAYHFFDAWVSLGFGQSLFDRVDTDPPQMDLDSPPIIRSQTGISAGLYYRLGLHVVLGVDYFQARYGFDKRYITPPAGAPAGSTAAIVEPKQVVNILNGGVTLEW